MTLRKTRLFIRIDISWSYQKSTTTASKLSSNWEHQGKFIAMCVTNLPKIYSIPTELITNTYQTSTCCSSYSSDQVKWEAKGAKHIHVLGMDDKRQVMVIVSTTANDKSMPF